LLKEDWTSENPMFFLRKISGATGKIIGYLQVEINAPVVGECWLPMLVFSPTIQSCGFGEEVVTSLLAELSQLPGLDSIGLNVYAENPRAMRFWYRNGFDLIVGIDAESAHGRQYNCITLRRDISR